MRFSLVIISLMLAACGGSSSSPSPETQKKQTVSDTNSLNVISAKVTLSLSDFPVSDLNQITFQSMNSSSIPAIKTFD